MRRRQARTAPLLLAVVAAVLLAVTAVAGGTDGRSGSPNPGLRQPAVPLAGNSIGVCATCFTDPRVEPTVPQPNRPVTPPQ